MRRTLERALAWWRRADGDVIPQTFWRALVDAEYIEYDKDEGCYILTKAGRRACERGQG